MKTIQLFVAALLLAYLPSSYAQQVSELACEDFKPSQAALDRFPDLIGACEAIVERNGELYGKFTAVVRRVSNRTATLYLPATQHTFKVSPDSSARVLLGGKKTRVRDLQRGQEIHIYLSTSEFGKPDIEEVFLVSDQNILITTAVEPAPMLPKTATQMPGVGLAGLLMLAFAVLLRRQRLRRSGSSLMGLALLVATGLVVDAPRAQAEQEVAVKPGRVITTVMRSAVIVEAVDRETRQVKLIDATGRRFTTVMGDEVVNFDQIMPRDRIVMEYLDSVAIVVMPKGAPEAGQGMAVEVAAPGEKPAMRAVETQMIKAQVVELDLTQRRATLQFEDGSIDTITVARAVPLDLVEVGDEVRFRVTHAVALSVRKVGTQGR